MRVGACLLATALVMGFSVAGADESDPLPVPKGGARRQAIVAYNDGVKLMVEQRYAAAQRKFEEALGADEGLAETQSRAGAQARPRAPAGSRSSARREAGARHGGRRP
jgi:hypothetical protein